MARTFIALLICTILCGCATSPSNQSLKKEKFQEDASSILSDTLLFILLK